MQDGGGRHLKKSKNRHISAVVGPILTKFSMMMQFDPLDRLTVKNLTFLKSKMAAEPSWKIDKSRYLGRVLANFNKIWRGDVVRPSWPSPPLKMWNFKIHRRPPSLKNRKITISRLRLERFQRNLAQLCSLILLNVPTVKNLKILKFTIAAAAILKNWKIAILQGFELIGINCNKSNALTTRLPSH